MFDIAGIEELNATSDIDRQMQARARRTAESADLLISVVESLDDRPPVDIGRSPDIRIRTKIDLGGNLSSHEVGLCAPTGAGLDQLRHTLDQLAFGDTGSRVTLSLNARHLQAISDTRAAMARARADSDAGHEWIALHLRESLDHLGQITGTISPDELLGKIFSKFCIGK
jgi:tRNA modification GTPase